MEYFKRYYLLYGCGILDLEDGDKYDCGDGGSNIMFANSGDIYEDSGYGSMSYQGTVVRRQRKEFTGESFMGKIVWDGSNYILETKN